MAGRITNKEKKEAPLKKECAACHKLKVYGDFFLSNNDFHKSEGGRFPVCKVCVKSAIDINDLESVENMLVQMNRPFLAETWNKSVLEAEKTGKDLFGLYYKNTILNYKDLTWKNSIFEKEKNEEIVRTNQDMNFENEPFIFNVTKDMILRWGQNHDVDSYIKLEDFYHKMKLSNKIETHQEETYLKKLAAISLKMDKELEAGNSQQVKQLGDLFSKFMADSKFRAMDKTEADKTGGIRNFSTIFSEVEKDGHIPPWEYYKKLKNIDQDIVDKTIMHIENFTLRLNKVERMIEPPSDTPKLNDDEHERVDDE